MPQYNIDPFGKMMETERWIASDKLNRQQIAKQNALRDIQQQSAQLGVNALQNTADFKEAYRQNPVQAQVERPFEYAKAFPSKKPLLKDLGKGPQGEAGLYDVSDITKPVYVGPSKPTKSLVNVNTGGDTKKFAEVLETNAANRWGDYTTAAKAANDARSSYDLQRITIKSGLETGALAPLTNAVAAYAEGFGINPETLNLPDPSKGQIFEVATFKQLLNALKEQKGPQTEGDAQRALKTFGGMGKTVEANLFMLDYLDEIADRTEGRMGYISEYVKENGESRKNFEAAEKSYLAHNRKLPYFAVGKKGAPITYGNYRQKWQESGGDMSIVDKKWRQFVAQGK